MTSKHDDTSTKWALRLFGRTFLDQSCVQVLRNGEVVGSFYTQGEEEIEQWRQFTKANNLEFQDQRLDNQTG